MEDESLSALSQQLQARLPTTQVQTIPVGSQPNPTISGGGEPNQFDGTPGGKAVLRGLWQLQAASDGRILTTQAVKLERKVTEAAVSGLVKAQSALLADLASQIVQGLAGR